MKTRLNILCALIFIAIAGSIIITVYEGSHDFLWGFKSGGSEFGAFSTYVEGADTPCRPMFLSVKPETIGLFTDSAYNAKTGEWLPLQYRDVIIAGPMLADSVLKEAVLIICTLIIMFAVLVQLLYFFKLIYDINQQIIFEWSNVMKLRVIGVAMLVAFGAEKLSNYIYHVLNNYQIDLPGYDISNTDLWDFYPLIPGLGILLMAEVFAMGLRLREEHDLTI